MRITRKFDSRSSIKVALSAMTEEINREKMFPSRSPKQLIEGIEHKQFLDYDGNPISAYCGLVTQQLRPRNEDETAIEIHYAVYPFGIRTSGNIPLSVALDNVDSEIEGELGVPLGEVQMMREFICNSEDYTYLGGVVVQAYMVNALSRVFK